MTPPRSGYDKSSQWMVLNRPSVEAIVSEESWRELEKRVESKRAKWNILTDEFYFMTVVVEHHLWTNDVRGLHKKKHKTKSPFSPQERKGEGKDVVLHVELYLTQKLSHPYRSLCLCVPPYSRTV